jgi:hypothetical protein
VRHGVAGAWPDGATTVAVAVGSAAAARALLGRRLLGIPALVAGAALARGVTRGALERSAGTRDREKRRAQRQASREATRGRERARERAAHTGAWHPEPEVVEVKSPAELEPGIAHGVPEPTFPDRVSRRRGGARQATSRGRSRRRPEPARDPDAPLTAQEPRAGYVSPPPGAGVRGDELGATAPPDELDEPGEDGDGGGSERG